ncbi:MAG: TlpA family protein disulfide reductase, partial [Actinobacteria bacterium]|nr:TlpA family protein disulfide reductase [Actinomycetota bacterium]NIS36225.1 TlpA family protein disulfide reductase [Actinomycetota bacterium]NIU22225.1 TlpA family protein disulfide reductase [Actinomycetota bacterium]NIU70789.1 TlpA family protein disulfide reductase [Actinomycetota bacterium]NIV90354.1 redoxin family protein [Actinomycetota bacterium]
MTQTRRPRQTQGQDKPQGRKLPILPIIGGLAVVALIATVILTMGDGSGEFGEVTITGEDLGTFGGSPSSDPAIGMMAPDVVGQDFGGSEVTIRNDGRAKMIVFLAHWCPYCQAEVPVVVDWLEAGGLPAEVDLVAVATGTATTRDNYPPSQWLQREGFDVPTILDSKSSDLAGAFGLNAYPYWVFVNADGSV